MNKVSLSYRLQVDTSKKKIAILKPSEQHLPDELKTFHLELSFGTADEQTVMLTADDLIVDETGRIGVNFERIGRLPANARFGITTEELKRFRDNIQNKSEGS